MNVTRHNAARRNATRRAMSEVYACADRFPARVTSDAGSMYGWSEYRLRHGESFVYTRFGDTGRAETAQDGALAQIWLHVPARIIPVPASAHCR